MGEDDGHPTLWATERSRNGWRRCHGCRKKSGPPDGRVGVRPVCLLQEDNAAQVQPAANGLSLTGVVSRAGRNEPAQIPASKADRVGGRGNAEGGQEVAKSSLVEEGTPCGAPTERCVVK